MSANGYHMEVVVDSESIDALGATIQHLGSKFDARIVNIHLEFLDSRMVERHLTTVDSMEQAASEKRKADDGKQKATHKCANCGCDGHRAGGCAMPNLNYGCTRACPLCNTKEHSLDYCPQLEPNAAGNEGVGTLLGNTLVIDRANRPQIRSERFAWFDLIVSGFKTGALNDPNAVFTWPWSNEFAIAVGKSKPGDAILQGKFHPSQFVPGVNPAEALPEDPKFKGKTAGQIVEMVNNGEFDHERFVPVSKRTKEAEPMSKEDMTQYIQSAITLIGARDEGGKAKPRSMVLPSDVRIKQEDEDTAMADLPFAVNTGSVRDTGIEDKDGNILCSKELQHRYATLYPAVDPHRRNGIPVKVQKFHGDPEHVWGADDPVYQILLAIEQEASFSSGANASGSPATPSAPTIDLTTPTAPPRQAPAPPTPATAPPQGRASRPSSGKLPKKNRPMAKPGTSWR